MLSDYFSVNLQGNIAGFAYSPSCKNVNSKCIGRTFVSVFNLLNYNVHSVSIQHPTVTTCVRVKKYFLVEFVDFVYHGLRPPRPP